MKKYLLKILDFFFPRICYSCEIAGTYLCDLCEKKNIQFLSVQNCHVCKKEVYLQGLVHRNCKQETYLDGVVVALKYNKFIEHLLTEFKYEFITDIKILLCRYLAISFRKFYAQIKKDFVITYVPLHKKRELWRGYNQTEVLAKFTADNAGLVVEPLLNKSRETKTQVGLHKRERKLNVHDSFEVTVSEKPERVVIVDDVMTTGSTLEECAKTLKMSGVKEVYGLVIARG
jgi:competence protein ComFC